MSSTGESSNNVLVIAIPVTGGQLCTHFGHSECFAVVHVDTASKKITDFRQLDPPVHQPGVLPRWLAEQRVGLVISGGMGQRALDVFSEHGIKVICGAPDGTPEKLVRSYLDGELKLGENICDH